MLKLYGVLLLVLGLQLSVALWQQHMNQKTTRETLPVLRKAQETLAKQREIITAQEAMIAMQNAAIRRLSDACLAQKAWHFLSAEERP